jgi:hypothetical protein
MTRNDTNSNDLAYADTLWTSAVADCRHVVLGLLFLQQPA